VKKTRSKIDENGGSILEDSFKIVFWNFCQAGSTTSVCHPTSFIQVVAWAQNAERTMKKLCTLERKKNISWDTRRHRCSNPSDS